MKPLVLETECKPYEVCSTGVYWGAESRNILSYIEGLFCSWSKRFISTKSVLGCLAFCTRVICWYLLLSYPGAMMVTCQMKDLHTDTVQIRRLTASFQFLPYSKPYHLECASTASLKLFSNNQVYLKYDVTRWRSESSNSTTTGLSDLKASAKPPLQNWKHFSNKFISIWTFYFDSGCTSHNGINANGLILSYRACSKSSWNRG